MKENSRWSKALQRSGRKNELLQVASFRTLPATDCRKFQKPSYHRLQTCNWNSAELWIMLCKCGKNQKMPATIIGKYPKDSLGQDVLSLFWMVCFVACSTPFGAWYSNHNKPSITTFSAQGREERRKIGVALAFAVELSRQNSPSKPSSIAMVPETSRVSGRCNQCTRSSRPLWTPGGKMQPLGGMTVLKGITWLFILGNNLGNNLVVYSIYVIFGMTSILQERGHENLASKTPTVQMSMSVGSVESWQWKTLLVHRLHTLATSQFWSGWLSRWFPTHGQTKDHMYRNILIAWRFEDAPT